MRRLLPAALILASIGLTAAAGPAGATGTATGTTAAGTAATVTGTSLAHDEAAIARLESLAAGSRATGTRITSGAHGPQVVAPHATSWSALPDYFPVGTLRDTYIDTQRSTPACLGRPARAVRYLPTTIWYPAAAGGRGYDQGTVRPAAGRFPLVVFAHGWNASPATYQPFLHTLAAAGYVVAAPTFPTSHWIDGVTMPPRSNSEMVNQAYDMSAVIGGVQWRVMHAGWLLGSTTDISKIAVIGHSDGGMTVAGMQLSTGYYDARPKVTVVMSGAGLVMPGGTYGVRRTTPLLVEQATQDPYNAYGNGRFLFDSDHGLPRTMLSVTGSYHIWPLIGNDQVADLTRRSTLDFLNWRLKGWGLSALALAHDGGQAGFTAQQTLS